MEAELQAIALGAVVLVALPAEVFTWDGVRIKTQSPRKRTYVVTYANGMIG